MRPDKKEALARKLRAIVLGKDCSNENWNADFVKSSWLATLDQVTELLREELEAKP